jgi:hypothetical protein
VDYAPAYYFRGYLQANSGRILQPYANLFATCPLGDEVVVRPYLSVFNSSHFADHDRMSEMTDVMLGAVATWRGLTVDARYAFYDTSPIQRSAVHELGAKASVDVLAPWQEPAAPGPFSVRPFFGLYGEVADQRGSEDVYAEAGVEPAWRGEVAGRKVGVSAPLLWGLSVHDYYLDARGRNEALGYFSASLAASVALPAPDRCGEWFLNVSVQYLHLFADSVVAINNGGRDVFLGKVGVGCRF